MAKRAKANRKLRAKPAPGTSYQYYSRKYGRQVVVGERIPDYKERQLPVGDRD